MNNLRKVVHRALQCRHFHRSFRLREINVIEPPYLESMKSKLPMYDTLNIQLRGYDYAILENYQKFMHNLMKTIDVSVEDAWATPHQEIQVTTLKPKSELVNSQFNLKIYERTIQITDVVSYQLPLVIRILEASTPAGVTVHIVNHEDYHDEVRYVPDTELKQLKQELDDMGGPLKKK